MDFLPSTQSQIIITLLYFFKLISKWTTRFKKKIKFGKKEILHIFPPKWEYVWNNLEFFFSPVVKMGLPDPCRPSTVTGDC